MHEINEVFELNDKMYLVAPATDKYCTGCAGENPRLCKKFPYCASYKRSDNKDVIFVEADDCKDIDFMQYFHSATGYRSKPIVNMANDMVKVEFRIPKRQWSQIKNLYKK